MKRNLIYLAALSALALTACSQDEAVNEIHPVNTESSIGFRTNLDRTTVSRGANSTTAQNISNFTVTAFNEDNSLYFHKLQVKKEGTAEPYKWTYSPEQVWPQHGLHFFGVSGATTASFQEKPTGSNFPKLVGFQPHVGYIWNGTSALPENTHTHHDVLAAYYAGSEDDGSVEMNFQHILSQIEVQAKNTKTDTRRVDVIGVRLMNLAGGGDFEFGVTGYTATTGSPVKALPTEAKWNLNATLGDYFFRYPKGYTAVTLTATPTNFAPGKHNFMVIPQQTTAWAKTGTGIENNNGTYISVACRISNVSKVGEDTVETLIYPSKQHDEEFKANTTLNPEGHDLFAMAMVPVAFNLERGKKYTYILDFSNGSGLVDPSYPDNPDAGDIDPNPGDKGDEIEGTPISFTVTVSDWKTPNSWNGDLDMDKANGTN